MAIKEVFPNPTVKKVAFEVRFSHLFYLDNKIGDIQTAIIDKFPESELAIHRQVVFVEGSEPYFHKYEQEDKPELGRKVWQFSSPLGYKLSIRSDSLSLFSTLHKTYNNPEGEHKFRDMIDYVLMRFLDIAKLHSFKRVGLRYIDHCQFPAQTNESFTEHFNSGIPISRFNLSDIYEAQVTVVTNRGNSKLRYSEHFDSTLKPPTLVLDFDAFIENILSDRFLEITDNLHEVIIQEYENSIKQAVYHYMRGDRSNE